MNEVLIYCYFAVLSLLRRNEFIAEIDHCFDANAEGCKFAPQPANHHLQTFKIKRLTAVPEMIPDSFCRNKSFRLLNEKRNDEKLRPSEFDWSIPAFDVIVFMFDH